jgi:hypothetical protein
MFCVHLLLNICFCGEFLPLGEKRKKGKKRKKKKANLQFQQKDFWGEKKSQRCQTLMKKILEL